MTLLKTPPPERKPDNCQIVAFSQSKRRAGYNGEEKFTRKTNSKTVPYKFLKYRCQMAGIFHR
jgi:hypothetical protein